MFSDQFLQAVVNGNRLFWQKLKRAPQEFFCVGAALYPRPIPYEMWPKIMRTQCSISICLKMGLFWKVRKMSKTSVFQGFSRKWWKYDDPKPHQIRCRSDYWDFKPKSIRFGWNLIILQNKEWCRVAWSLKCFKRRKSAFMTKVEAGTPRIFLCGFSIIS